MEAGLIGILKPGVGLEGVPGCHLVLGPELGLDWHAMPMPLHHDRPLPDLGAKKS